RDLHRPRLRRQTPSLNRACGCPAHGSPPSSRRAAFRPATGVGLASQQPSLRDGVRRVNSLSAIPLRHRWAAHSARGPSLWRVLLSTPSSLLRPPPTPAPLSPTSSGCPLIGFIAPSPPSIGTRAVSLLGRIRVSPVPTTTLPPFHVPYAAGFFGAASPSTSPLPWPSPDRARLGSRLLPCGHSITTRQTSLDAADWWVAPSLKKARPHASTPGSLQTPVGCYRGCLAPPLTGLAPVS